MSARGWDAVIVSSSDPHNSEYPAPRWKTIEWLSGFTGEAADLVIDPALYEKLNAALLEEPAVQLRDGDVIASTYNEELATLRELRDNVGDFLTQMEIRERASTGIPTLRVQYNKVQGFFIEISRGQADRVPLHYHRKQTLKNTERYITPELKEYEDKALSAQERSQALQKSLYNELLAFADGYVAVLQKASAAAWAFSGSPWGKDGRPELGRETVSEGLRV